MKHLKKLPILVLALSLFIACSPDDDPEPNDDPTTDTVAELIVGDWDLSNYTVLDDMGDTLSNDSYDPDDPAANRYHFSGAGAFYAENQFYSGDYNILENDTLQISIDIATAPYTYTTTHTITTLNSSTLVFEYKIFEDTVANDYVEILTFEKED